MINLTIDKKKLSDLVGKLEAIPKGLARSASMAINKTLTSTRAEIVRVIRAGYALKAGDIRKELEVKRSTPATMIGRIAGESSPGVPLISFARIKAIPSTRRTKSGGYTPKVGIPVLIKKTRGKVTFKGAFVIRLKSGHVGVFVRADASTSGRLVRGAKVRVGASKLGKRYVKEKYGPTPIKLLGSKENLRLIENFAQETMDKNMQHEAEYYLSKAGL